MGNRKTHFREKVKETQVYQSLRPVQKGIVRTRQNLDAIGKSLEFVQKNGIKVWEEITQNKPNNAEIIRELHAKNLDVNLNP
jgi:hypothetical protein